jgi:hypothetical protein
MRTIEQKDNGAIEQNDNGIQQMKIMNIFCGFLYSQKRPGQLSLSCTKQLRRSVYAGTDGLYGCICSRLSIKALCYREGMQNAGYQQDARYQQNAGYRQGTGYRQNAGYQNDKFPTR